MIPNNNIIYEVYTRTITGLSNLVIHAIKTFNNLPTLLKRLKLSFGNDNSKQSFLFSIVF